MQSRSKSPKSTKSSRAHLKSHKTTITPLQQSSSSSRHFSTSTATKQFKSKSPRHHITTHSQFFSTATTSTTTPTTPTTTPVPTVDLKKAKSVPIYFRDEPASLEFFHFSDPKWRKSSPNQFLSQKDPFQLMLQHPVGQVVISQWIGNHISLHLRHVLKHPETQLKTKNNKTLLVGYDINSEYVKDIHGKQADVMDEDDPRHARNKTKLIVSPHQNIPKWDQIQFGDYGYALFDPNLSTYDQRKQEYDEALEKHQKWAKLCGIDEADALKQELSHRDQYKKSDGMGDTLQIAANDLTSGKSPQQVLLESTGFSKDNITTTKNSLTTPTTKNNKNQNIDNHTSDNEDLTQLKLTQMTLPQQVNYVGHVSTQAAFGLAKLLYIVTARTTQLITPGGAKTIYKELTKDLSKEWFVQKFYGFFRSIAIGMIRGGHSIYKTIDSIFRSKIPFLNRFIRARVDSVADNLVAVGTPVLDTVHNRIDQVNRVANWVDEWLGTEYKNHPNLKKLNNARKLEVLLELSPHPGNPPLPPKGSPYQKEIAPTEIFTRIGIDKKGSTMEDLLHAAEIDDHRLLLSYLHRLRNTSKLSIGLCPDQLDIPKEYYQPRINSKGMLETPLTAPPATPELALLSIHDDTFYQQAGLRKDPDVWLSKRLLDKIPSPDLLDLAQVIKSIDPSFTIPKTLITQRNVEDKANDKNDMVNQSPFKKTTMEVLRGLGIGFVIGTIVYEGYLISNELNVAFQQFPEVSKGELAQDYFKFYLMRMKYSTTALLDTAWYGLTEKHLFAEYQDSEYKQSQEEHYFSNTVPTDQPIPRERKRFSEAELQDLLRSVEMQLESDLTKNNGEQQPFTILNGEQAAALMQFNEVQNSQVLALSEKHAPGIPSVHQQQSSSSQPIHFQPLTQEEINEIEQSNPNLKAQVNHPFGISQQDMIDIETVTREMSEKHEGGN